MENHLDVRPTYVQVNLDNLIHNFDEIRRNIKEGTMIMPVIKANGYGHGSVELGKLYKEIGAERLAVSLLNEGVELRRAGINGPLMILNYTPSYQMDTVVANDLIQSIYRYEDAFNLSKVAGEMGKIVKIHIKIDSGMGRVGFLPNDDSVSDIIRISKLSNLEIEGIFTHFAKADETDKSFTRLQFDRFMKIVANLEKEGLSIPIKHVSNSAAIIDHPEYNLDLVRPGIMLYGYYPSFEVDMNRIHLKPAMTLKAIISNVKDVEKDTGISYGHIYHTERKSKIATVPIGYADGYSRLLSKKAEAFIKGKLVPVVGRICMDQLMLDVTDVEDVKPGDEIVFFGEGVRGYPSVDEVSEKLGTINYELVCMMGRRLPRVYLRNGKIVKQLDYLLD